MFLRASTANLPQLSINGESASAASAGGSVPADVTVYRNSNLEMIGAHQAAAYFAESSTVETWS